VTHLISLSSGRDVTSVNKPKCAMLIDPPCLLGGFAIQKRSWDEEGLSAFSWGSFVI
jgi:hypothetical protein